MTAYYNEFDPFAAAWLRELIKAGHIAPGDVDERSILEVKADDLKGYTQCHFFAGIGGWSYALRLAEWSDDRPVWTGSCPCQPFSSAGKQGGKDDSRHLLPVWLDLISECRPPIIFGEQVASAIAHGWLDDVYSGLEAQGYAVGAAVLPACSVGAPHRRDRLWFVADSNSGQRKSKKQTLLPRGNATQRSRSDVGDAYGTGSQQRNEAATSARCGSTVKPNGQPMADAKDKGSERFGQQGRREFLHSGAMDNAEHARPQRFAGDDSTAGRRQEPGRSASSTGFWGNAEWLLCADGKARPVEPSIPLLAHGVSNRVGKLRGYGNAIVPEIAAEFLKAYMDCCPKN